MSEKSNPPAMLGRIVGNGEYIGKKFWLYMKNSVVSQT